MPKVIILFLMIMTFALTGGALLILLCITINDPIYKYRKILPLIPRK